MLTHKIKVSYFAGHSLRLKSLALRFAFLLLVALFFSSSLLAQAATINVDAGISQGTLFRSEAYNNISGVNTGAATRDADYAFMNSQGLHAKVMRVWVSDGIYNENTGVYDYASYYSYLNSISNLLTDEILMCIPANTMIDSRNYTPAQCKPVIKNILSHYKALYPKIKYIEAMNEPDLYVGTNITPTNCYSFYKAFVEAVNEVNAELNPAVPLQVGGPAISSFKYAGAQWLRPFLDAYAADTDPNKRLDFISYHIYSYKNAPREASTLRPTLEQWLAARGLPTSIPSFITETGLFPGSATSGTAADDALRQAAGMVAYVYWETESALNVPFNWVMRHADHERKDQIVTRPSIFSDRLTPYGNMIKMMAMLKSNRVKATTSVMNAEGIGVYPIAASDATGISLLLSSYQHTLPTDYYTTVNLANLPAIFNGKSIRKKVYRIDAVTSNHYYNINNCNLALVSDTVLANGGTSLQFAAGIITENSLQLIMLEPVDAPQPDPFDLYAQRQGNYALLTWNTETENASVYFEVMRSADGTSFAKIGHVAAAGNSTSAVAYQFADVQPLAGTAYYQVRLVAQDSSRIASAVEDFFINTISTSTAIYFNFGSTGAEIGTATSGVPAGWTVSPLIRANAGGTAMFSSTSPSNTYSGFSAQGNATMGANAGSLNGRSITYSGIPYVLPATGISALSYFELTLTPAATETIHLQGISFGSRSIGSGGGPAATIIRTNQDNFAANLFASTINPGSSWTKVTASFPALITATVGAPLVIRIYANDALGGAPTANNWRIDDLNITVLQEPEAPPVHTLTATEQPNHSVLLSWQTSSETDINHYEIEHGGDGINFINIGQVAAVGNSGTTSYYTFNHPLPVTGINYYRIRQVSNSAAESLSDGANLYIERGTTANIYYSFGPTGGEYGDATSGLPSGWTARAVRIRNSIKTTDFFTSISPSNTYAAHSAEGNATIIAGNGSLTGRSVTYGTTTTVIPATGIAALSYFEVSIHAAAPEIVQLSKISFGSRSIGSSGGPASVLIRTSADNFGSDVYAADINANSSWTKIEASFGPAISAFPGDSLIIRIYANDAIGGVANNWRIDDVTITCLTDFSALPVSLLSFSGQAHSRNILLQWMAAETGDFSPYIIERAADGIHFYTIGQQAVKPFTGTMQQYMFADETPLQGLNYYRLRQQDAGLPAIFSSIVSVKWQPGERLGWSAVASKNEILIHFDQPVKESVRISVYTAGGAAIKHLQLAASTSGLVPISLISTAGLYIVQVTTASGIAQSRWILKP